MREALARPIAWAQTNVDEPAPEAARSLPRLRMLAVFGPTVGVLRSGLWLTSALIKGEVPPWALLVSHVFAMSLWGAAAPAVVSVARRWPLTRDSWHRSLPWHFAALVLFVTVIDALYLGARWLGAAAEIWPPYDLGYFRRVELRAGLVIDTLVYAAMVGFTTAADYYARYREGELRASQLRLQLTSAQLAALKLQLNPHFLFNTLNSVSALIPSDPRTADAMVVLLGKMLRATLDTGGSQEAPLRQELELARAYVEIQKARLGSRLTVEESVDPECLDAAVPSLLLQPLVENAITHGAGRRRGRSTVRISVRRADERLVLAVSDDGPGPPESSRPGVGLTNTRMRLAALYGERGRLELTKGPAAGSSCRVEIPWRVTSELASPDRR